MSTKPTRGHNILVQCCRCRNKHMESERVHKPSSRLPAKFKATDLCCPRCGCKSFFDLSPQVAWCWASGLIEIGDEAPVDRVGGAGAIVIARGPKASLEGCLNVVARHGQGKSAGQLLVPGVPEAEGQQAKGDALAMWLDWCRQRKSRYGVVFAQEVA